MFKKVLFLIVGLISFSSYANLMRVDINFEATNFAQHNPFGATVTPPPIDFVSGSISFLIEDPAQHSATFIADEITPISFNLTLGGVDFSASDISLQYRLFRNQFWSFFAGADIDGAGLDEKSSVTHGTTDFWIDTVNFSTSFFYTLEGVDASFNSDSLVTQITVTAVNEPGAIFGILLLSAFLMRFKSKRS